MARANGPQAPVMDRLEKATKTPRRHAGPWGASFDGTDPNGKPTKGLTLPLMSYGGSAIVMNLVALAIVLRVDIENRQMMRGGRR